MFMDLEATLMAAMSLTLLTELLPGRIDPQFLCIAKEVLQDMKRAGNSPAEALLMELDDISGLVTNVSKPRWLGILPQSETPIRMIYDGQVLNCGIANIVRTDVLQAYSSISEPSHPDPITGNVPLDVDDIPQLNGEQLQSTVNSSLGLGPPMLEQDAPQADGLFLDYFDASAIQLDSDMTNSNWLDFV